MLRWDAVLFDVDGTLLHSKPGIIHTMRHTFRTLGVDISGVDLDQYLGPPLCVSFANHFDTPQQIARAEQVYREEYHKTGQHDCTPFAGCIEMLTRLAGAGLLLCTATCKPVEVVTPILKEQGILGYFAVVGGATMDGTVTTKTEVIRTVLANPALAGKRVLMVGDRRDDMEGAAANGLPAAGALYGYGSTGELAPYAPCYLADSCRDLADYILQSEN